MLEWNQFVLRMHLHVCVCLFIEMNKVATREMSKCSFYTSIHSRGCVCFRFSGCYGTKDMFIQSYTCGILSRQMHVWLKRKYYLFMQLQFILIIYMHFELFIECYSNWKKEFSKACKWKPSENLLNEIKSLLIFWL